MAVTGEQVYTMAMVLIDEVQDTGDINEADTASYRAKSPHILTALQTELLPSTQSPVVITDLTQNLLLSDKACLSVLPYGLAAHLMLSEDPSIASFYNSRYEELRSKLPKEPLPITDAYNVLDGLR